MKKNISNIKGTKDIFPEQSIIWETLESYIHSFLKKYGYGQIINPIFENTDLFNRSIGQETDIVSKEMYSWVDQGDNQLTLRPEFTASVVRSFIQHQLWKQKSLHKFYYIGDAFRRERPQKGRFRQFRQFGIESFGSKFPEQDAEVIMIAFDLYSSLGISDLSLKINSIGSKDCRKNYKKELASYFKKYKSELTETSKRRLKLNPLRILDTKVDFEIELIKDAPKILDFLNKDDRSHFNQVIEYLDKLKIPYEIDNSLVRGLDYYCRTVFEIHNKNLGTQNALCGGGRYDYLVEELGGDAVPAIGFAAGFERLLMAINNEKLDINNRPDIYLISLGENAISTGLNIASKLREKGLVVINDMLQRTLKAQMKDANRLDVNYAIIIGEDEIKNNSIQLKNMQTGDQKIIKLDQELTNLLKIL